MTGQVVTRCSYCKGIIESSHAKFVDFHPTIIGRMVEFHADCEGKRGTPPPEKPKASVTRLPRPKPESDDYDD